MKVAIDGRYAEDNLTGIGKYIKNLASGLVEKEIQCFIFYSKRPKHKIPNCTSVILKSNNKYYWEQYLLPRNLRLNKINLYHAVGNVGIPLLCNTPSVLTVHDIIPLVSKNYFYLSKFSSLSKTSYFVRTLSSCLRANKIITITKYTRNELIQKLKINPKNIVVVNSGINIDKSDTALPRGLIKKCYLLNNGGIDKRKNLDKIIKIFSQLNNKFPEMKLVITGDNKQITPYLQELSSKLNVKNKVIFTGYVSEKKLWALIRNSACICYLSSIEGFGSPIIEGFSAKVPVIASNSTCLPETSQGAALLVDPEDDSMILDGIIKILTNYKLRKRLISKGITVAKKYSWKNSISETINVYKQVLK